MSRAKISPRSAGFTLIELLVVISIIGLLASVILVSLQSARSRSRDAKRVADMNQIAKGLELYYNENSGYPVGTGVFASSTAPGLSKFIVSFPSAPKPADGSCVDGSSPGNNVYYYAGVAKNYTLTFCLGTSNPGGIGTGTQYLTPGGFRDGP